MLISIDDALLPIKKGFWVNSIDEEKIHNIITSTINQMALAYLRILGIQGENPVSMDTKELPLLEEIDNDNLADFSIADYLIQRLLNDDAIELDSAIATLHFNDNNQNIE